MECEGCNWSTFPGWTPRCEQAVSHSHCLGRTHYCHDIPWPDRLKPWLRVNPFSFKLLPVRDMAIETRKVVIIVITYYSFVTMLGKIQINQSNDKIRKIPIFNPGAVLCAFPTKSHRTTKIIQWISAILREVVAISSMPTLPRYWRHNKRLEKCFCLCCLHSTGLDKSFPLKDFQFRSDF